MLLTALPLFFILSGSVVISKSRPRRDLCSVHCWFWQVSGAPKSSYVTVTASKTKHWVVLWRPTSMPPPWPQLLQSPWRWVEVDFLRKCFELLFFSPGIWKRRSIRAVKAIEAGSATIGNAGFLAHPVPKNEKKSNKCAPRSAHGPAPADTNANGCFLFYTYHMNIYVWCIMLCLIIHSHCAYLK